MLRVDKLRASCDDSVALRSIEDESENPLAHGSGPRRL